jgi:hypothetical protein
MAFLVRRQALSSGCLPVFFCSWSASRSLHLESYIPRLTPLDSTIDSLARKPNREHTRYCWYLIVSKSSFLLLFLLVAFLATAVSLQSGGKWWGDVRRDLRSEARANVYALKDDASDVRAQAESVPSQFRALWNDVGNNLRILKADVTSDARMAAKRLSTFIKTT